jgi:diacylglycerol kinase family enzyme
MRDSLRVWHDFESGKIQVQAIDLGVIVPSASPERTHYFCGVAGCGLDSAVTRSANQMPLFHAADHVQRHW